MELRGFADAMVKESNIGMKARKAVDAGKKMVDDAVQGYKGVGKPGRPRQSRAAQMGATTHEYRFPILGGTGAAALAGGGYAATRKKEAAVGNIARRAVDAVRRSGQQARSGYQSAGKAGRPGTSRSARAGRYVGEHKAPLAIGAGATAAAAGGATAMKKRREKRAEQILEALQNG